MDSSDCDKEDAIEIGVIGIVSTDLEIGKFEGFDSTSGFSSGLTSGTPPSTDDVVFLDISPPSCLVHSNKPP